MRTPYDFGFQEPPALSETALRAELERRRLRLVTILLAISGLVAELCAVWLGFSAIEWHPWLAGCCLCYVLGSAAGGCALLVFHGKKEAAAL